MPVELYSIAPVCNSLQGVIKSSFYNGARFEGHQKSKGNRYDVEVILQVLLFLGLLSVNFTALVRTAFDNNLKFKEITNVCLPLKNVDMEESFLCGYLKIKGLTDEFPTMVTFFDGEIISEKHPFLTRKWDADEDVDQKHWVSILCISSVLYPSVLELLYDIMPACTNSLQSQFSSFEYSKTFNLDDFDYSQLKDKDVVFMRWKVGGHFSTRQPPHSHESHLTGALSGS